MNDRQLAALRRIGDTIVDAVRQSGPMGAPGGHIYAALMQAGCTFDQFEQIMAGLVQAGLLVKKGDCYHVRTH